MSKDRYQNLGASATKDGLHAVLDASGLSDHSGLFAPVLADVAGEPGFKSFLHCDGAGTKSIVAYLHYRETKDPKIFAGLAQDALVMNLDDVYCIGKPQSLQLANLIARNAKLIDDTAIGCIIDHYQHLTTALASLGIPLVMGGGETADCGDVVRTLLVDAVISGRIATADLIHANQISPGDVIIGLSSSGQSTYEETENSGIGSNGLTLARHALLCHDYLQEYPECCDPAIDLALAYQGPYRTVDTETGLGMTVGEALCSPTRTYAPVLHALFEQHAKQIHAAIHLTGGAHTKVLRFGCGNLIHKDNLLPAPPIFRMIQAHGKVSWEEMYKVFNMGQRLELYVPADLTTEIIDLAASFSVAAQQIGRVEAHPDGPEASNRVQISSEFGDFTYQL